MKSISFIEGAIEVTLHVSVTDLLYGVNNDPDSHRCDASRGGYHTSISCLHLDHANNEGHTHWSIN